jgi:hypothetical protein
MIHFFTDPYKDELLYSTIARYHYYSGNTDCKDTIQECFGRRSLIPTFEIGGRLGYLSMELGGGYTAESLINNNTILPYYYPFIDLKRRKEVLGYVKANGCNSIYTKLGIVAGSICKKNYIYYCPICARKDIDRYGETYIHREHQLQGIILCPHDGSTLKEYSIRKLDLSRIEYIRLEKELLDLDSIIENISYYDKHLKLAKDAYFLLTHKLDKVNKNAIWDKYRRLICNKGLSTQNGTIKQGKLYEAFIAYYGEDFLKSLDCSIVFYNDYNWLKVITRKSKRSSHPLRHLLLINFLCGDIEEFFTSDIYVVNKKVAKAEKVYRQEDANDIKLNSCKDAILEEFKANKDINRTKLRERLKKEYMYIYRYDKEWLFNNLPRKSKSKPNNLRVDWIKRDQEYMELIRARYEELLKCGVEKRITIGNLAKPLGILGNLEKKIDKLPKTKEFLEEISESAKEFQLRRCKATIDKILNEEQEIKLWKVQRIAAIRSNQFEELKDDLIKYIESKQLGGVDGEKEIEA